MKMRFVIYWIATGPFCFAIRSAGVLNVIRFEREPVSISALGYSVYLMTILGVAKIFGVTALLTPKPPLLKEWAYARFVLICLGYRHHMLS
ncbi:MAG: DoxX family protein [Planctomycetota bacterium]